MRRQFPQGGRIINIGSIAAHAPRPFSSPYTPSKHALLGLIKGIALDGRAFTIVCTPIDIGNALTWLWARMQKGALQANGTEEPEQMVDARQVYDAVVYIADLPLSANVLNMTLMASKMSFLGRG
ncbi:SDR family NAD(P)-dependent oxidoreductase (plasmid) [Cupriavidus necator]|uniref:SDR family NAD(P)-dependent oxidoreductase n=1 Tax=Cupriavidus necator TaxID=106590 RepID=A0A367PN67_CUPNE|nr:SDR family NAD(P)-dependent oxidoreductase [Cupriavidus necator]RCJ09013.1 SDR family NAD(P)-dependent oxidoreductase [Cupriavidus necator]